MLVLLLVSMVGIAREAVEAARVAAAGACIITAGLDPKQRAELRADAHAQSRSHCRRAAAELPLPGRARSASSAAEQSRSRSRSRMQLSPTARMCLPSRAASTMHDVSCACTACERAVDRAYGTLLSACMSVEARCARLRLVNFVNCERNQV